MTQTRQKRSLDKLRGKNKLNFPLNQKGVAFAEILPTIKVYLAITLKGSLM